MALPKAYDDVPAPSEIRPQGENSKFSKSLYRWAHNKDTRHLVRIYQGTKGRHKKSFYIGLADGPNWLHGARLISAFHNKRKTWAFHSKEWGLKDITKKFWREYMKTGACGFHDWNHDWQAKGKTKRICNHCSKVEVLKTRVIKEKVWQSAATNG